MVNPEENLKQLRHKRGSIKSRLTLFKSYIDNLSQLYINRSENLTKNTISELEMRIKRQEPLLSEFDTIQCEIECLTDGNFDLDERANFENSHFQALAAAQELHDNINSLIKIETASDHSNPSQASFQNPESSTLHVQNNVVKLPSINLPKFDGHYDKWLDFKDSFKSLINENNSLSDVNKLHYLKLSLEGDANRIIQSLPTTSSNYSIAWNLLCERYDNESLLIFNHVKSIFNMSNITSESSTSLRKMHDDISKNIRSLELLGEPVSQWDTLLIFVILSKLDTQTVTEWETTKKSDKPKLSELLTLLQTRAELLEKIHSKSQTKGTDKSSNNKSSNYKRSFLGTTTVTPCPNCKDPHSIYFCPKFKALPTSERIQRAKSLDLCTNCLKPGHLVRFCKSGPCRICNNKHNTMLHINRDTVPPTSRSSGPVETASSSAQISTLTATSNTQYTVHSLLSTAIINVLDSQNRQHKCRALLDTGSQSSFISSSLANKLRLPIRTTNVSITGIGQKVSKPLSQCEIIVQSMNNSFSTTVFCYTLTSITDRIPSSSFNKSQLAIPSYIELADPGFNESGPIDILLGADVFWSILEQEQIRLGKGQPVAQKTKLGWIISGPLPIYNSNQTACSHAITLHSMTLEEQLTKFWEVEEISSKCALSTEEEMCEEHFTKTFAREPCGRFSVSIPFKETPFKLGDSRNSALKQFYSLEKRLQSNSRLKQHYVDFMSEYIKLDHMTKISNISHPNYFLPHHGVLKETSETTKLRVVFNGSSPSTSGWSLNKLQMVGPTIQDDLVSILLRFRKHRFVASADIAKMYRQVLIQKEHRAFQYILWRSETTEELNTYQLNTVTYGTASASYLAIRSLNQLAIENRDKHPVPSRVISNDFYVDDMLTGADSIESLTDTCQQVNSILQSGGFELRKWCSNAPEFLQNMNKVKSNQDYYFNSPGDSKTLGLFWSHEQDCLYFFISEFKIPQVINKRAILSDISQIFDPLGLLSPCIVTGKILLQKLWTLKTTWDEKLPADVLNSWQQFRTELLHLNSLKIPRYVLLDNSKCIELHGFSDASLNAYGSCIYLRTITNNEIKSQLLIAKTRVAPLKTLTIPRLELCGALMLARLYTKVKSSLNVNFEKCFLWTDSMIVLGWLRSPPNILQIFPSNRVAEIQRLTKIEDWRHIPSGYNPADLLSRGMQPKELIDSDMWWKGPQFLRLPTDLWPCFEPSSNQIDLPEIRKTITSNLSVNTQTPNFDIFDKFSNYNKLLRVTAFCLRFISNARSTKEQRYFGNLQSRELNNAQKTLVKLSQKQSFFEEIKLLNQNSDKHLKRLGNLNPFLDDDKIIRVGGRLQNSNYSFDKRHPICLDSNHKLTILLFQSEHLRLLHAGPQLLLSTIRNKFWPIGGRNLARKTTRQCIRCFKCAPKLINPLMGNLPKDRVTINQPFNITGVDYAGPFYVHNHKGRGSKVTKAYICLFVCFAVKAIHLELVSDLTSESFLACFRRFIARRGKPSQIYSDNGTNFVGASNELRSLYSCLINNKGKFSDFFAKEGIVWHFIPPSSPHFGGLWEAGVKSTKYHVKRVLNDNKFTFEEMYTFLTEVECVLNSRPLSPLSSDPSDLNPLTPGHFLIGKPLVSLPENDLTEVAVNRLTRYQHIQKLKQHFWTRWSKEYVSELQQRCKWKKHQHNIKPDTLVLLKEDNLPPQRWRLGRVIALHPGKDNTVRVVSLKTNSGIIKRSVAKICPLPISD